jgi:hypothetical protein
MQVSFKIFFVFLFLCSNNQLILASEKYSKYSMNGKSIVKSDSSLNYSFFVSGHFHGSSNNTTGLPSVTVTNNLQRINSEGTLFLVSLGDLFLDVKNDIPAYKKHLIDKLSIPLFNTPGNHDLYKNVYENNFGSTFYFFTFQNDLFIFFNTELNDGSISGIQMKTLREALKFSDKCNNIFVFTHRLIWAEEHPKMKHLFKDNTRSKDGNNFWREILPLINKSSKGKNVYFMGGSLGNSPSPFFYYRENRNYFIATAIRNTPKDAFLKVNVINGKVSFSAFPLVMPIEYYDLDFYNGKYQEVPGFNWRLVPLYIKNMFFHRYFWYGISFLLAPILLIYFRKKIRKK